MVDYKFHVFSSCLQYPVILINPRKVLEFKNYQNLSSTSKDTYKTLFIIYLTFFVFVKNVNLKRIRFSGELMTQYTRESRAILNHMRT